MDEQDNKPNQAEESEAGSTHPMTPDEMVDFEENIVHGDETSDAIPDNRVPPAAPD